MPRETQLTAAATTSTPHAVLPTVRNLAVSIVPPPKRVALAKTAGSRRTVEAEQTKQSQQTKGAQLVGQVQADVHTGYSLVGVTWTHRSVDPATLQVALRTRHGSTWSSWSTLAVDPDEGPSRTEDSVLRDGTEPLYVGDADALDVDVYSRSGQVPRNLTVAAIDPGTSTYDAAAAKTGGTPAKSSARDPFPHMPRIVTRRQWGADERLGDQCWAPRYGSTFKTVFVHHTAGSNSYTRRESASIVRGIYAYHTQSRGWCDIGYNFLVDRYGTVYEGRAGGIRQPVRGAHAGDYNVNSTGISLMGEFTSVMPTLAMRRALTDLVTWRLGVAYHGGYGHAVLNGHRFARISGHRDAMSTACPGQRVYDWLPTLRAHVNGRLDHFTSVLKRYWTNSGGSNGRLGPVRIGEVMANGGHHTTFRHGRSYFKHGKRRTIMAGPLLTAYVKSGETNSRLGYPRTHVFTPRNGTTARFEGGSLYWAPKTGSHLLANGKILSRYRHVGGPAGRLGFPKTRLRSTKSGSYARFQHGTITFDKHTRRTTVSYR